MRGLSTGRCRLKRKNDDTHECNFRIGKLIVVHTHVKRFFFTESFEKFLKAYKTSMLNLNYEYDQIIFSVYQQLSISLISVSKYVS